MTTPIVIVPIPTRPIYFTTCPNCGHQLAPYVGHPSGAPWLCGPLGCSRGWFACELSTEARASWHSPTRSFDYPMVPVLVGLREKELIDAHVRRTSAIHEHIPMLDLATLEQLAVVLTGNTSTLASELLAEVEADLKAKGRV